MNKLEIRYAFVGLIFPFFKKLLGIRNTFIKNNNLRILYFHNIPFEQLDNFKRLIEFISEKSGFISPQEAESFLTGQYITNKPKFLLTFDDGFVSDVMIAKEVLNPEGICAIFFVCPNFIGLTGLKAMEFSTGNLNRNIKEDLQPMGWEDIEYLIRTGHTIGAHTLNHVRLSKLSDDSALESEIVGSADMLEEKLGKKIIWFAYPFGDNNSIDVRAYKVIRKRYRFCCTALRGKNTLGTNPYNLCRDHIDLRAPMYYLEFILEGGLDFFYIRKLNKLERLMDGI